MASSNVIQTNDQTGKLKWQNLDSAFGGQYEDLLTLGKGEAAFGVVPSLPTVAVVVGGAVETAKVSGKAAVVFLTSTSSETVDVSIAELVAPVGAVLTFVVLDAGAGLTLTGLGLSAEALAATTSYVVCPDGTLALCSISA
jgi:hypothetical protein